MKFFRLFRLIALACVLLISPTLWLAAGGQTPAASPRPSPATSNDSSSQPVVSSTRQILDSRESPETIPRERRARGYSKLLEGQRLLADARRGENEAAVAANVRSAQQAFQEASQLDPTLAEAYTALAEIALFYPPRNLDEAIRQANIATKINPNNYGAHQLLSRIYGLKSGLNNREVDKAYAERAIAELREVTRLVPNDGEAWALLGELYLALGRTDEAIQAITRWSGAPPAANPGFFETITGRALTPDSASARLAEAFIRAGRPREAIIAIRRAIALNPENGAYDEVLTRAVEAGGTDDAALIADLKVMAAAEPQSTGLTTLLARVLVRAGRVDEAISTLRAAINRRSASDRDALLALRLMLAQTYGDALHYQEAIAIYEEVLKDQGIKGNMPVTLESDRRITAELLRRIVTLQKSAGKASDATLTIERMRRLLGADDPTIDLEYVALLREQGKRREALDATRAARGRFPQQNEFLHLEAAILTDLGQVDEGVRLLRSRLSDSTKAQPSTSTSLEDFDLYLRISNIYTQAGRAKEAVEAARQALERAPADRQDMIAGALITLSSAQERAGDSKGSEESLRRVLAKEPGNATALNNLGYFLVERNERLNEALEMIQRAVRSDPTNSSFLDSLGWAHFKLGQLTEAERHLSEAARRDATSSTIQDHLGDVYNRQGKKDQARAAWQKALRLTVEPDEATRIKAKLEGKLK